MTKYPRSRRARLGLYLGALMVGAVVASVIGGHSGSSHQERGVPDPGGRRLASLRALAPHVVPAGATHVRRSVRRFSWDPQTCDGQSPGWARAAVEETFDGPRTVPGELDARMRTLGWHPRSTAPPSSGPAPTQGPKGMRVYLPDGSDHDDEVALLTPPGTDGTSRWDFALSAGPAVRPAHNC